MKHAQPLHGSRRGAGDGSGGPAWLVASGGKHNPGARTALLTRDPILHACKHSLHHSLF